MAREARNGGNTTRQFGEDKCQTCRRADVLDINGAIAAGRSIRSVAIEYGIRYQSLHSHWHTHVLTDEYEQGAITIGWHDVVQIPLVMRERRQLQDAIINRILAPLSEGAGQAPLQTFQSKLLIDLWKLQMADEQTILKVAGVLRDTVPGANALPSGEQFQQLQATMEAKIAEFSKGDWAKAADIRLAIAQSLDPRDDLPDGAEDLDFTGYLDAEYEELP